MRPLWLLPAALLAAPLLGAADARAQVLRGKVADVGSGRPIAEASLTLLGPENDRVTTVATDSAGEFVAPAGRAGTYRVRAERVGYRTVVSSPLRLARNDTLDVEIRLSTQVVLLDPLKVVAPGYDRAPRFRAFYDRLRQNSMGLFVTREQIAQQRPLRTTDLLRTLPGLSTLPSRGDGFHIRLRGGCAPTVYIDGTRTQTDDLTIDDLVRPMEVEGIEIYRSIAEAPVQYQGIEGGCSAILVWTRIGND